MQASRRLPALLRAPALAAAATVISVVAMFTACDRTQTLKQQQSVAALRSLLEGARRPSFVTRDGEGARLWKVTQRFYKSRNYELAWIEDSEPRPQMAELIKALWAGDQEGLDPLLYNVSLLDERRQEASKGFLTKKGFEPKEAGNLDVWLTYVCMKYASDLADGLSDLAHADPDWQIKRDAFDPRAWLERALADNTVAASLRELTPHHAHYVALRKALADYKAQAANGGWPAVPATKLKPGQRHPNVAAIARRLHASGDYAGTLPPDGRAAEYRGDLVEAVRRFQRRHGLADDGVITPAVVAEMNVAIKTRIAQIQLNLERWRWLPRDLGERHILVNIPEYRLEVWDHGQVPLAMRTVVGKQDTPTPIFNDAMTHVVFSPYWNVPPDIAEGETLPALLADPAFLQRQNMEVLDQSGKLVEPASIDLSDPQKYRFRQKPGSDNSLGLVKFMFPNQFNVYLHDTPADSLFSRASRSFSHGCVRLEAPLALARYVLQDQPEWTEERIVEAMQAGEEKHVKLKRPIPVYLGYWTARVSSDGQVQFRSDVYGIDDRQGALLADRLGRMRKTIAAGAATVRLTSGGNR
jgi:murein L,D-transpeptidase YcbB/YkuD